jgi:hypothetical protein
MVEAFRAILNFRLHHHANDVKIEFAGQSLGILGFDDAIGCEVANKGFDIFYESGAHLLDLDADVLVLRADLATEIAEGAAEEFAKAARLFFLVGDNGLAIISKPFQ